MNKNYFTLILLAAYFLLPNIAQAHGPIPMPLEAINKILDKQFPQYDANDNTLTDLPPIESDLLALNSKDRNTRSDAYKRLLARGDNATPEIIKKINTPDTVLLERKRLIHLLGLIKTPGTDKNIIEFTEFLRGLDTDVRKLKIKTVYFQAFRALEKYDDTSAAIEYANKLLDDENIDPIIHSQALFFLVDQDTNIADKWVRIYNNKDNSIDEQYALAYAAVKTGTEAGIKETKDFLFYLPKSQSNYQYETRKILSALIRNVDADELQIIIKAIKKDNARFLTDRKINSYPLLADLYSGQDKDRKIAALALLGNWSKDKNATIESLEYMISINDTAPYINLWKLHHPVLIRFVNHLGYTISFDGNIANFIEAPDSYIYKTPIPDLLVESLIDSFKNNNINSFKASLFPDERTFELINEDTQNNRKKQNIDELYDKFKASAIKNWSNIIKKASLADLNWDDIKYKTENRVLVGINGAHISKTTIHIEGNNKKYEIILESCVLFNNKWYFLSGMKWS